MSILYRMAVLDKINPEELVKNFGILDKTKHEQCCATPSQQQAFSIININRETNN